jgi:IS30 family transposase
VWNRQLVKLTKPGRERVVRFHAEGMSAAAIATRLGVSNSTTGRILAAKPRVTPRAAQTR